jgi:DNA-directed RNA polymerase subunit RPC12/RpoP
MRYYCANCGIEFESTVAECPNCGEDYDIFSEEDEIEEN